MSRAIGRRQGAYVQNVIIVGSGSVAQLLADKIAKHSEYGLRVVGFVDHDDRAFAGNGDDTGVELVGTTHDLPRLVREHAVHRVAIAFSTDSHDQTLGVIRSMQDSDVQIDIVPRMFEVLGTNAQLHTIEGIPLVGLPSTHLSGSSRFLKRLLDVSAATLGLVLLAPIFLVVSVLIKLDSRGPVFFRQIRMGAGDRTFRVFKFRTMVDDAESQKPEVAHLNMHNGDDPRMFKVPDDPRVTRLGRFLRRWRMDELPQLLNVLFGEHVARRAAAAHSRRGPACLELGAQAAGPEAGHHRPLAGARRQRHPVRRDDEARLPLRHQLVAARGFAPDSADAAGAHSRALRVLTTSRSVSGGVGFEPTSPVKSQRVQPPRFLRKLVDARVVYQDAGRPWAEAVELLVSEHPER